MPQQNRQSQAPEQNHPVGNKEINPFSEQEKHGDNVQGREPNNAQEYQGNPSVQRRDHPDTDTEKRDTEARNPEKHDQR
jgi:hypothetical protein